MLLSEGVSRATRLITIVAMAAFLSGSEYGVAMLALACHELFRVFMRAGAGPKIIQCADADLPSLVGSGGVLQWLILLCLAAVQIVSAHWLAHFYNTPELVDLLQWMALSYLFYPLVSMRVVIRTALA